ncbi:MAG TPA: PH domain-containing protein [Mycobacteriales bacterium]|nr:PH domain-containing protein [Mycobacteriales bacterium]
MTGPEPIGQVTDSWSRVHPLSPVVRAGRAVVGLLTIAGVNSASQHQPPWDALGLAVVAIVAGVVYWRVTRWRIQGGELQIDTGLLRRQQIRVPLTQIQGVDLVRPLVARMFGVAEVRVVLASHGAAPARLAYIAEERAVSVRARLLAIAHGLDADVPAPPERPIIAVPPSRIIAAGLASARFGFGIVFLVSGIVVGIAAPQVIAPAFTTFFLLLALTLVATGRQVSAEWDFRVAEAPDGLRLESGLLQHRAETVPYGRIQAVRWVEPLLWRPFGWVRLEFDVARQRSAERGDRQSAATTKALFPVGSREEARWLLARVLPGATGELPVSCGVPAPALLRIPLARRYARMQHDATYLSCSTGRVRPSVVIMPLAKIQSVRWVQGPWSRKLNLASVYVDTAGHRYTGSAAFRGVDEAQQLVATLPGLARDARRAARA